MSLTSFIWKSIQKCLAIFPTFLIFIPYAYCLSFFWNLFVMPSFPLMFYLSSFLPHPLYICMIFPGCFVYFMSDLDLMHSAAFLFNHMRNIFLELKFIFPCSKAGWAANCWHGLLSTFICDSKMLTLWCLVGCGDSNTKTTVLHAALCARNLGAESGREMFKGLKDAASSVVHTRKNFLVRGCGFFVSDVISGGLLGHLGPLYLALGTNR